MKMMVFILFCAFRLIFMQFFVECPPLIDEFIFPLSNGKSTKGVYLCGNSLGLQPRAIQQAVMNQFEKWGNEGVEGHFSGTIL